MNQTAEGAWYFSRDGQQSGPLTFAELKEKADQGALKPRTDLVWKEGLADWMPVGEIEGMFERREVPGSTDPLAASAANHVEEEDDHYQEWPGARRRSYLFITFIFPFVATSLFALAKVSAPTLLTPELWKMAELFGPLVLVILLIFVCLQRFANLGMSRWWFLAHLIPFVSLWTNYRCFACPEGYAVHKRMDGAGIFLAIVYWLVVAAGFAAIAFLIAILAGAAGNPEIQQQLKDGLEQFRVQMEAGTK